MRSFLYFSFSLAHSLAYVSLYLDAGPGLVARCSKSSGFFFESLFNLIFGFCPLFTTFLNNSALQFEAYVKHQRQLGHASQPTNAIHRKTNEEDGKWKKMKRPVYLCIFERRRRLERRGTLYWRQSLPNSRSHWTFVTLC